MAELDRHSQRLFVACLIALPVCGLLFYLALAPESLRDLREASVWYALRQLRSNPLLIPSFVLCVIAVGAWIVMSRRERERYREDLRRGAVPSREIGVIDDLTLAIKARDSLEPAITQGSLERVIDALLGVPVDLGASEITLDPEEMVVEVSLRVGPEELPVTSMPWPLYEQVLQRLRLIIAVEEEGEGQIELRGPDGAESIRVVLQPGFHGTKARLQVLRRVGFSLTFDELGMTEPVYERLGEALDQERGLVLMCGGRGQGVTTTMYAAAHRIDRVRRNPGLIGAMEQRIGVELPFIYQVEVGDGVPAEILRSLLEREHAVLLVHDLSDEQTAALVGEAAKTKLVLASLGAADRFEALAAARRLSESLVEPSQVLLEQRLVRRLCPACKREVDIPEPIRAQLGLDRGCEAVGCDACGGSGYAGMRALFSLLCVDEELADALEGGAEPADLRRSSAKEEHQPSEAAVEQARAGTISFEDAAAVIGGRRADD